MTEVSQHLLKNFSSSYSKRAVLTAATEFLARMIMFSAQHSKRLTFEDQNKMIIQFLSDFFKSKTLNFIFTCVTITLF